jgi:predicted GIY-YIG superfamily endonuclease
MKYVYILHSLANAEHFYTDVTDDLDARLSKHNSGSVTHTAKYLPWYIKSYVAFADEGRAIAFEKYLKSGSGRAFAKEHLRGKQCSRSDFVSTFARQNRANTGVAPAPIEVFVRGLFAELISGIRFSARRCPKP